MNVSRLFIHRPVATTLLTLGVTLAGMIAFFQLPVSPLPQVDFPTISVQASLPGASPETMAATVATPLERVLGRIAGVNEMTSSSSLGSSRVTLQFDLSRDINGAARDVQAGINAARTLLPSSLPSNPTWRKVNPADAPIMLLALTSDVLSPGQMYDAASTVLAQRLAQIEGIGQVNIGGAALPAVRVDLDPERLSYNGIGLEEVRQALVAAYAFRPLGILENKSHMWQLGANDQSSKAVDYRPLLLRWNKGAALRLQDVAQVTDGVQDTRNFGASNGKPAVLLILYRQPGANIIATVDRVKKVLPHLKASIAQSIDLDIRADRTPTIRASLKEVERNLVASSALVVLVVFLFLRRLRAAVIPSIVVPVSLIGSLSIMALCGYSLDNLSLMALTIATGFVVDDAIVVLENIVRHMERGMTPVGAALRGAREIGFTVISISLSLVAVFLPILLMGGIVGRLFREFAATLSATILVSMVISLTTTPMLCARLLKKEPPSTRFSLTSRWGRRILIGYRRGLAWSLRHAGLVLILLFLTFALNVYLYMDVQKGFFPQQDNGRLMGNIQADQGISFRALQAKMVHLMDVVLHDPAVDTVTGFTGGGQRNSAIFFMALKPLSERKASMDQVIDRLRKKVGHEPGVSLIFNPVQDVRLGGRPSNAQFQFTLQADHLDELRIWETKVRQALAKLPELVDVNTDQQNRGVQTNLTIDRDAVSRLGLSMRTIDATLNDAFGQRQIATIYNPLNQYKVVMEVGQEWLDSPAVLDSFKINGPNGVAIPLASVASRDKTLTPLAINHQGGFPASTISFNLPLGGSLGTASSAIDRSMSRLGVPATVMGSFQGTAKVFQDSLSSQPWLILGALVTIYIVLGVLYESLIHPLTILSTLPSAGVGALLALEMFHVEFTIIALIGVFLLIGIVKKNAIIMIDVAIDLQKQTRMTPAAAIYRACHVRFRPILMTTLAAVGAAIPLALGSGDGAELRVPLGISIVGGLLVSQLLTLYTVPVVYVVLDRWRTRKEGEM
ncbi:MAG: efflux RND transporter permease subunit [Magnetococcales bacterium]|nr:efflux RND transporter permease subunit [Magnetococcales bacterium]